MTMWTCLTTSLLVFLITMSSSLQATEIVECSSDQLDLLETQVNDCVAGLRGDFIDQVNNLEEDFSTQDSACVQIINIVDSCGELWSSCYTDTEIANLKNMQLQTLQEELKDTLDIENCQVQKGEEEENEQTEPEQTEEEEEPALTEQQEEELTEQEEEIEITEQEEKDFVDEPEINEVNVEEPEDLQQEDEHAIEEVEEETHIVPEENDYIDNDLMEHSVDDTEGGNDIPEELQDQSVEDATDEIVDKVNEESEDTGESKTEDVPAGMIGRFFQNIIALASRN